MFKYELGQIITIMCSEEVGEVIARAQYAESADCYLIRYKCGDGRAVEVWWSVVAIAP